MEGRGSLGSEERMEIGEKLGGIEGRGRGGVGDGVCKGGWVDEKERIG